MKNTIKILILSTFIITLSSCKAKIMDTSGKIKIVSTVFPIFEWVHELSYPDNNTSDNTISTLVIKNGMDYHSYKPADIELNQISNSDLFIYIGGESENWANEIAENPKNPNQISINLLEVLKNSTLEKPYDDLSDEHIWLSLKNAKLFCMEISNALIELNPDFSATYEKRLYDYLLKLETLDHRYENDLANITDRTIIICDRNPFYYLFNDYNISSVSPFTGCSKISEIDENSKTMLISKINEYNSKAVMVTENSDKKDAKNIILNSKNSFGDVNTLDSFQSSTLRDAFNGKTYIKTMERNLTEILKTLE